MASPNISEIVTTTMQHRSRKVADNVTKHNALLSVLKSEGGIKTFSGGDVILEELSYAENSNGGSYSGFDILPTAAQDHLTSASFNIKQYAVPVVMSGLEMLMNSGKEKLIDLLEQRLENADATMKNLLNTDLYGDGTGNGGKKLTGLGAAVVISPASGTYGGIDRATWSFWQNKKSKGGGTDFAGSLSTSNVGTVMNAQWLKQVRGSDKPNLIIMDENFYAIYEGSLQANQRFESKDMAALGFDSIMYKSANVVFESTASGMTANTMYFLNTKYLKFRPHADRNMVPIGGKRLATNQDAEVQILGWAGNLTCSGAQFQGIVQN